MRRARSQARGRGRQLPRQRLAIDLAHRVLRQALHPAHLARHVDPAQARQHRGLYAGLVRRGVGVIVISSELAEIIGTCDRVLVMREGYIAGEVASYPGQPISQEAIMELSTGTAAGATTGTAAEPATEGA